jgi:hypothetical protein
MGTYAKFIVQAMTAIVVAIAPLLAQGVLDSAAWVNVAIVAVGALGVLAAPNAPHAPVTKAVLAGLTVILVLLHNLLEAGSGWGYSTWWQLGLAALGAIGVYLFPNQPKPAHA